MTVALVAASGVLPTEVLGFLWMPLLRDHLNVTAYLFFLVTGPVVAAMAAIQAFVLSRVYRAQPVLLAAVYVGVYAATYVFWLSRIFNPLGDLLPTPQWFSSSAGSLWGFSSRSPGVVPPEPGPASPAGQP